MNPIRLYFVGARVKTGVFERVKNVLCSYLYIKDFYNWIDYVEKRPLNFIIDSGAYSAWTLGRKIDLNEYINFCKSLIVDKKYKHHEIKFVNLDVIPGRKGMRASKNEVEEAAKQGFKNLCQFIKKGITPIHVFHQGENFKWIDKIVEKTDYLGIGTRKDTSRIERLKWIDDVFTYLYKNNYKVKIHGFGFFIIKALLDYPWTSIDSSHIRIAGAGGRILYPRGGFSSPDYSKKPLIIHISNKGLSKKKIPFLDNIEKILKKDGYFLKDLKDSRNTRVIVNTHYYIELERELNKLKKNLKYKPSLKLLE